MKYVLLLVLAALLTGCMTDGALISARRCGSGVLGGIFDFAQHVDNPFMSTGMMVGLNATFPALDCVKAMGGKPSSGSSVKTSNVSVDK